MLSDATLRNIKPEAANYKLADRDGMYVTVTPKGTTTFPGSGACANTNAGRQAMSKSSKNFDMIDSLHTKAGSGWPQPTNNVLE